MAEPKYIDAELLRAKMYHDAFETDSEEQKWDGGCWIRYKMFERNIEAAPAADVEEVKHGNWEWNNDDEFFYSCSNCGHKAYGNTNEIVSGLYAYCPNCGARMEGEQNG